MEENEGLAPVAETTTALKQKTAELAGSRIAASSNDQESSFASVAKSFPVRAWNIWTSATGQSME
jgi:hypothetical protein